MNRQTHTIIASETRGLAFQSEQQCTISTKVLTYSRSSSIWTSKRHESDSVSATPRSRFTASLATVVCVCSHLTDAVVAQTTVVWASEVLEERLPMDTSSASNDASTTLSNAPGRSWAVTRFALRLAHGVRSPPVLTSRFERRNASLVITKRQCRFERSRLTSAPPRSVPPLLVWTAIVTGLTECVLFGRRSNYRSSSLPM